MVGSYHEFGSARGSAPVAEYGHVLDAAGMGLTPMAEDASEGTGCVELSSQ